MSYITETEKVLLSELVYNGELIQHCDDLLPESFLSDHHAEIYRAVMSLSNNDQPINFQTIPQQMEQNSFKPDREYILELNDNATGDSESFLYTLGQILEIDRKRKLANHIHNALQNARDPSKSSAQVESELELALDGMEKRSSTAEPRKLDEITKSAIKGIEQRYENQDQLVGITTGLTELDLLTGGFRGKQNIVIAGRSGTGKTAFMLNILESMAKDEKAKGSWLYVASYEMEGEELAERMLSSMGKIQSDRIRSGKLKREDFAAMTAAAKQMFGMNIYIDDVKGSSIHDMRNRIKRLTKKLGKPSAIMMDYVQLLKAAKGQAMQEKLEEASWQCKALAAKYDCPFIQLSQVNRSCEGRPDKRPLPSDLKGSGAIEQDADIIILLYRDEVYNPDSADRGTAEINVAKHRGGEAKMIRVQYIGSLTRFQDLPANQYATV